MSTNTSQNLGLHLWEPTDQVLRTEFNENWQKLDTAVGAALTPEGAPCQYGTFYFTGSTAVGTVLKAFSFQPRLLVLEFGERTYILPQGDYITMKFGVSNFTVRLKLSGSSLVMYENDEDISVNYSGHFVAWP